ncbi:50S ribosomal protein L2 [bacterium AB1]|nr:50S ribosomal protein L2 [bacterium AB1]
MKLRRNLRKNIKDYKDYRDSVITTNKPYKPLVGYIRRAYGRNHSGQITVRHIEKGTKALYRLVSFSRKIKDINGIVKTIEYDPFRTAFISLVCYAEKHYEYIIATSNMKVGSSVIASDNSVPLVEGCATMLKNIPQGTIVHNVEQYPKRGGTIARSAGAYATVIDNINGYVSIRLTSGFVIKLKETCYATIGQVSNIPNKNRILYKAGQSRHRGIRPTVRGVAMNPVDHPHGGGEGKTGTKRHPVSYTCVPTKGYKTAGTRSLKNKMIVQRKKRK